MMRILSLTTAILCALLTTTHAFVLERNGVRKPGLTALTAKKPASKPKYDKVTEKWEKAPDDDGIYPYDAIGALLRHGPSPFISRLTNPSEYEQGILKYMAGAGVSRAEATGNMDAKLNNAMDWVYQKTAEKNGAPKVDYTELKAKNAILVIVWAFGITPLAISVVRDTVSQFAVPERYL